MLFGADEVAFEAAVDGLAQQGADDVLARFELPLRRERRDAHRPPRSFPVWQVHRLRDRFRRAKDAEPDLHILYGGNEAGKTTIFSAYLDLLFGIEVRPKEKHSRYSFLHSEPTMRIGAALELDGGIREFVRIKRPQNTLLDAADRPLAEGVLAGELGGLDRAAYRAMFSLDDDTIELGGDSILQSKGDLGQLLFSASAGLSDLSRQLGVIREEAARFL